MKKVITVGLLLAVVCVAQGRVIAHWWSHQEAYDKADLVVIARPATIHETSEKSNLGLSNCEAVGLFTDLDISLVMKGDQSLKKLTLHHFRLAPLPPNVLVEGGPNLVTFDTNTLTSYLMFLHRDTDGKYSPVSGQTDPTRFSIFSLGDCRFR